MNLLAKVFLIWRILQSYSRLLLQQGCGTGFGWVSSFACSSEWIFFPLSRFLGCGGNCLASHDLQVEEKVTSIFYFNIVTHRECDSQSL
jgi:hypothetical protein